MRINKFVARATGLSRRESDDLIKQGRIKVNGETAQLNTLVSSSDQVLKDQKEIVLKPLSYLVLNKPIGYLSSRRSQGEKPTLYELLPEEFHNLQVAGRLDYDTSGLVLLTNDGDYANNLMHPRYQKVKRYVVELDKPLKGVDLQAINLNIELEDGLSKMRVTPKGSDYDIEIREGRNRQIRRTFDELGYEVKKLHRYQFGPYTLDNLTPGNYALVERKEL